MTLQEALVKLDILKIRTKGVEMLLSFLEDQVYTQFQSTDPKIVHEALSDLLSDLEQIRLASSQQIQIINTAKVQINGKRKPKKA